MNNMIAHLYPFLSNRYSPRHMWLFSLFPTLYTLLSNAYFQDPFFPLLPFLGFFLHVLFPLPQFLFLGFFILSRALILAHLVTLCFQDFCSSV